MCTHSVYVAHLCVLLRILFVCSIVFAPPLGQHIFMLRHLSCSCFVHRYAPLALPPFLHFSLFVPFSLFVNLSLFVLLYFYETILLLKHSNQGRGTRAKISHAKISDVRLKGMRRSGQRLIGMRHSGMRPNGMRPTGMRPNGMRLKGYGSRERGLKECGPTACNPSHSTLTSMLSVTL